MYKNYALIALSALLLNGCVSMADGSKRLWFCCVDKEIAEKQPTTPPAVVAAKPVDGDEDKDGVLDSVDKCAHTPARTVIDKMGCPTVNAARGVLQGVNFKPASAELTEGAKKTLDDVATTLNQFPNVRAEVQGHTDNTGDATYNEQLSQRRAQAVVDYLNGKGVTKQRLNAHGYGPKQPIADNATSAGRLQNRRVELKWEE